MKFLHTADWHLGIKLLNQDRQEEHEFFLQWLLTFLEKEFIEVLLVSGDIFDSSNPPKSAEEQYYKFLSQACKIKSLRHIIITGGNHDSPSTLNAPKALLKHLNVTVVGATTDDIKEECLLITNAKGIETAWVLAIPFLRDKDVRLSIANETDDERQERLISGIIEHYEKAANFALAQRELPIIGMGHLFASGASITDSETKVHVGNLGAVPASRFPNSYQYLALGHLHRPQIIGGKEHIRYSGSPFAFSFSEWKDEKQIIVFELSDNTIKQITQVPTPIRRRLLKFSGTKSEIINSLIAYQQPPEMLPALAEITCADILTSQELEINPSIQVIKQVKSQRTVIDNFSAVDAQMEAANLTPLNVFENYIEGSEEKEVLLKLFQELLELKTQE